MAAFLAAACLATIAISLFSGFLMSSSKAAIASSLTDIEYLNDSKASSNSSFFKVSKVLDSSIALSKAVLTALFSFVSSFFVFSAASCAIVASLASLSVCVCLSVSPTFTSLLGIVTLPSAAIETSFLLSTVNKLFLVIFPNSSDNPLRSVMALSISLSRLLMLTIFCIKIPFNL